MLSIIRHDTDLVIGEVFEAEMHIEIKQVIFKLIALSSL